MRSHVQLGLEMKLGSFGLEERWEALRSLYSLFQNDQVACCPESPTVNLHCHTFFSFNAYDYSPAALAWEAKKRGLYAVGVVDFDVLDGAEEFLRATKLLELRGMTGLESRVFVQEWSDREINSPKEPGIAYFMGAGFNRMPKKGTRSETMLDTMRRLSRERNEEILGRINRYLREVTVDYEKEVLCLTPSGNATERHMLVALDEKARKVYSDEATLVDFWSGALETSRDQVKGLISRPAELQILIRSKLMKHGGPGYVLPEAGRFPAIEEVFRMVTDLDAVPTATWLDGTSEAEKDANRYLDYFMDMGIGCINIIPDRNWNIQDPGVRDLKVGKLHEIVGLAEKRHLPILVGTEMNKHGQMFVDDFHAGPMVPMRASFLRGARIMHGHILTREYWGWGLMSQESLDRFGRNWEKRNRFFEEIGAMRPVPNGQAEDAFQRKMTEIWDAA